MDTFKQDLRYAVRMLRRRPQFTLVAVLTLALGIAANSTIFSVVYGVLLRPLPYPDADRIVRMWRHNPEFGNRMTAVSGQDFEAWRDQSPSFSAVGGFAPQQYQIRFDPSQPQVEEVPGADISPGMLSVLNVSPMLGRTFAPEEGKGQHLIALISHEVWQKNYGGAQDVLSKSLMRGDRGYAIVGVMPPGFRFPETGQIWFPRDFSPPAATTTPGGGRQMVFAMMNVMARLKPGVTVEQARADMKAISARMQEEEPRMRMLQSDVIVSPLLEAMVGNVRGLLLAFFGAVGLVLLIACANVANLLLARAEEREREIAVRSAMGASRRRLMSQMLTESWLLAGAGGLLGLVLSFWGIRLFLATTPGNIPRTGDIKLDGSVLLFTIGVSVLTGILFGLFPALKLSRPDLNNALKQGGSGAPGSAGTVPGNRFRSVLIVGEIALSLVLLSAAGLMVNSFLRLISNDPGFNPKNLIAVSLRPNVSGGGGMMMMRAEVRSPQPAQSTPPVNDTSKMDDLLDRAKALPGVKSAALATVLPMQRTVMRMNFTLEGHTPANPNEETETNVQEVGAEYFGAMEIPIRKGRVFTRQDMQTQQPVVVVNEAFAKTFSPGQEIIGRRLFTGQSLAEVIGVVGDVLQQGLDKEPEPILFRPSLQLEFAMGNARFFRPISLVVRTNSDPSSMIAAVRSQVESANTGLIIAQISLLDDSLWDSVAEPRFYAIVFGVFSVVALVLAAVGVYGVLSYAVARRTHEIGVRMALGAQMADVLKLVLRQGMWMTLIGVALGIGGSLIATRSVASLLYGVQPNDPLTLAVVAVLLILVAFVACYIPARRATRVDPLVALRYE